jgi:hypothetical protein
MKRGISSAAFVMCMLALATLPAACGPAETPPSGLAAKKRATEAESALKADDLAEDVITQETKSIETAANEAAALIEAESNSEIKAAQAGTEIQ